MSAAAPVRRLERAPLLGMALFIASESIFFLSIVMAYIALRPAGLADDMAWVRAASGRAPHPDPRLPLIG